ncbi:MAG: hypothetical protein GY715_04600, partial [Planctomycetes bacterium]|nr:hypothetical protein [Planctomycetota bacterium]
EVTRGRRPHHDITKRDDGRPEAGDGAGAISIAHAGDLTLTVTDEVAVGCDVEPVAPRSQEAWADLLGPERFELAALIARERVEPLDVAATRVWAALECVKKAGLMRDVPLLVGTPRHREAIVLDAGPAVIATWAKDVRGTDAAHVFAVLVTSR